MVFIIAAVESFVDLFWKHFSYPLKEYFKIDILCIEYKDSIYRWKATKMTTCHFISL